MELLQFTYNLLLNTLGYGALPFLWSGSRNDPVFWKGRLARLDAASQGNGTPRVWFHAASVGEVTGAIPTLFALRKKLPYAAIYLTVATPQGFRFARGQAPDWAVVLPFPLEFKPVLERAFRSVKPDLYVAFESEFWPNLFHLLERNRVPAILLNGRISDRSAGWYSLFGPLFRPIFKQFRRLGMLSYQDMRNAVALGASPERTIVLGSSKYDGLSARVQPLSTKKWREILNISDGPPVVVGGSLRRSECIEILRIFRAVKNIEPECIGIFAPRHLERIGNMVQYLNNMNIPFHFLTRLERHEEPRRHSVILVDRIGVLFELYALGDLIFCGGTLEPIGGHNILEPAAWEKPVFYGPSLEKVYNEHTLLESMRGSFPVQDARELLDQWGYWIHHIQELKAHGRRARDALRKLEGVAEKQAELIVAALVESGSDNPS